MRRFVALSALVCVLAVASCKGPGSGETLSAPVAAQSSQAPLTPVPSPTPTQEPPHDFTALDRGIKAPGVRIEVFRRPRDGADSRFMTAHNPMGEKLVFLVTDARTPDEAHAWYRILLPRRPNGSEGWVKAAHGVHLVRLHERIEVDLSAYTLKHFQDGKLVDRFKVGVGQPQWPTPVGTFYIWAHVPQPSPMGPYGVYALGLSAFSPVLTDWPGGGRSAIHGTPYSWNRGRKVSHGCVRVFNPQMKKLEDVPMGTPVVIAR